jgi:hypothetical protein
MGGPSATDAGKRPASAASARLVQALLWTAACKRSHQETTMHPTSNVSKPTLKKTDIEKEIERAMNDLERAADEVRVKLHLAGLDMKDAWSTKLEPRLFETRVHAKEASAASKAMIESTLKALRDFAAIL